jgi:membrane associated rhomboid family serine protease
MVFARARTMEPDEPIAYESTEVWVPVGRYDDAGELDTHALVLLAMAVPCKASDAGGDGGFVLFTDRASADWMARELAAYDDEEKLAGGMAGEQDEEMPRGSGAPGLVWVFSLMFMFLWQEREPGLTARLASSSTGLWENGEWWRPVTAMFLHGDLPHLMGNALAGWGLGYWVARSLGGATGWLLILASGATGNFVVASLVYPEPFSALGASSAVFGALGILSGLGMAGRAGGNRGKWRWLAPVVAVVAMLGLTGAGGDAVDVPGHGCGFLAGVAYGVLAGWWIRTQAKPSMS